MVHIGRKSAIGAVITRQSTVKKMERKSPPVSHQTENRMAITNKRIGTRPSMA
jgi:hypothetical protein